MSCSTSLRNQFEEWQNSASPYFRLWSKSVRYNLLNLKKFEIMLGKMNKEEFDNAMMLIESKQEKNILLALLQLWENGVSIDTIVEHWLSYPMVVIKSRTKEVFLGWAISGAGLEASIQFIQEESQWYYTVIDENYEDKDGQIFPTKKSKGFKMNKVIAKKTLFKLVFRYFTTLALKKQKEARSAYSKYELMLFGMYEESKVRRDSEKAEDIKVIFEGYSTNKFPSNKEFSLMGFDWGQKV
jgi:hypothetical protein